MILRGIAHTPRPGVLLDALHLDRPLVQALSDPSNRTLEGSPNLQSLATATGRPVRQVALDLLSLREALS